MKMNNSIVWAIMVVMVLTLTLVGLVGCNLLDFFYKNGSGIQTLQSGKPRDTSPDATETELAELVRGNSAFAFDLYQALRGEPRNLFYSPYSISVALAMTYAGARGETEHQMSETLHFTLPQDRLHITFNALDLDLTSRGEGAKGKEEERFRLNIANAIWGQRGYYFLPRFLDVLAVNYGAGLQLLDFATAPDTSRIIINEWVSEQTAGKIKDLLPPGSVTQATTLVLTNAIYFNAAWRYPFDKKLTHDRIFHLLDGNQVTVPMMHQIQVFAYAEGDGYQAVELPYRGRGDSIEFSMVVLLPELGRFQEFEASLTAERVDAILEGLELRQVDLIMPKFVYDSAFSLKERLTIMGMPDAFISGVADFSGIDGTRALFISDVIHKAFVSVDEAGTEAAAATAVVMPTLGPPPLVEVMIDRPFIFMIRDVKTGTILFLGRVINPRT